MARTVCKSNFIVNAARKSRKCNSNRATKSCNSDANRATTSCKSNHAGTSSAAHFSNDYSARPVKPATQPMPTSLRTCSSSALPPIPPQVKLLVMAQAPLHTQKPSRVPQTLQQPPQHPAGWKDEEINPVLPPTRTSHFVVPYVKRMPSMPVATAGKHPGQRFSPL